MDAAGSLYSVLGVGRYASTAELRKAYRKQALLNHPDKNIGDADAQRRFLRVTSAYDVLSDKTKRARYDAGEGDDTHIFEGRDFSSASDLFDAHFAEGLMRQWRAGTTVSGILIMDGKRLKITIHPDGSTSEAEEEETQLCVESRFMSVVYLEEIDSDGTPLWLIEELSKRSPTAGVLKL